MICLSKGNVGRRNAMFAMCPRKVEGRSEWEKRVNICRILTNGGMEIVDDAVSEMEKVT